MNTWRSRRTMYVCTMAICSVFLASCGGVGGDPNAQRDTSASGEGRVVVDVGYAAGLTGRISFFDEPFLKGLEMVVEQVNQRGNVQINLEVRDAESDPAMGATVAREFIDEGVDFLITMCDADASLPGAQIAQQAGVPILNSCGSGGELPSQVGEYQFLNVYGTVAMGAGLAQYALDEGWNDIFVMSSNDSAYTQSTAEAAKAVINDSPEGNVVGETNFSLGDSRFSSQAQTITSADPDALITTTYLPESVAFLRELRREGYDGPVLTNDGNDGPALFEAGPDALSDVYVATHGFPRPGTEAAEFVESYKETYGEAPDSVFAMIGGDAAILIEEAAIQAATSDSAALRDAFAQLDGVEGITGEISYADSPSPGWPVKDVVIQRVNPDEMAFEYVTRFYPESIPEDMIPK